MKKKYIYLSIMGGIGDQIFQYCFANYLKNRFKCEGFLDVSYYKNKLNYNNFIFRLSNIANKNNFFLVRDFSYINYSFLSYLRFIDYLKLDKIFPYFYRLFFKLPIKCFIYEYWKKNKKTIVKENSYYLGYWHNFKYVKNVKSDLNKHLINVELNKIKLKKFLKKINKKTIAIHIRGGDFKNLSSHNVLELPYYKNAINFYKKLLKNPKFHIFTNDMNLSKKIILKILKKDDFTFIKNYKFSDIEEFSLYSKYNYAIIANSTFSLMSSYLSLTRKISIAPKTWLKGKKLDKKKQFSKLKFI